ncbi:MAG: hypothetical protein MRZ61_02685 [Oscillospiraceae bacterium]|nr:hypothetical protein [Oscillospiraceae bacterium]
MAFLSSAVLFLNTVCGSICSAEEITGDVADSVQETDVLDFMLAAELQSVQDQQTALASSVNIDKNRLFLGYYHSAYITENGNLYTWGYNNYGQLGDGTATDSYEPVKIMINVAQVYLGEYTSACITKNGELYTWGYNEYGQLGDGTTTDSYEPVKIMENVSQVSLGAYHSACITEDGDLYTWGDNSNGRLGDGTSTDSYTPKKIKDNVAKVSLGSSHSACITTDGDLYTWGFNSKGELGDGTKTDKSEPVKIKSNISQVSLGYFYSACITEDGELYTWGYNNYGQLGDGTATSRSVPLKIGTKVSQVSLGKNHSAYITEDGDLYTFGYNKYGQLGDNTTTNKNKPVQITSNVSQISLGGFHSTYMTEDGDMYIWGWNNHGQLGDGTTTNSSVPVKITFSDDMDHNHELADDYSSDDTGHWYECSGCSEKVDFEEHTEDSGTVTKEPTETEDGEKTFKCTKCKYVIRTETIDPLASNPVTVSDGTETKTFDTLTAALTAYKSSTATLTITLNQDAEVKTLSLPTKAAGITITGDGELNVNATAITIPVNIKIDVTLNGTGTKPLAVKVSDGKTLEISGEASNIGAVSGAKTSVLKVSEDMTVSSLSTFGEVNIAADKALTVKGNVSSVKVLNGGLKLPTATSTATVTTAGNALLVLTETNGNVAKATVNNVSESLTVNIVNAEGDTISIASGTTVLYSANDITEKVTVANETADNKPLDAFYYKKTKSIKAEWSDAVSLSYGGNEKKFPNMELALAAITDSNTDYTITLNTNVTAATLTLPKTAKSIIINGTGTLTTGSTSISIPVNTTIGCKIIQSAGKAVALKVAAGVTLTINTASECFGAVSGTKTSVLKVNDDMTAASLSTFSEVTVAEGKVLTVKGNVSSVTTFNGTMKLLTVTSAATITTAGKAVLVLAETSGKVAKVTVNNVTESLDVNVVNAEGATVALASGTTILYSSKDITEKVTIANETADSKPLNAFYYTKTKSIKAEWADAISLSYGENERKFPNMELALAAITDSSTDYTVTLNTDTTAATLTLPTKANSLTIKSASADNVKTLSLTGVTSLPAKTPLTLENVKIESTKAFSISASKDLTLDNFISDSISAVKGGSKFVLDLGETSPIDKVSGFGTVNLTTEFKVGTTFTTTALNLGENCGITVPGTKSTVSTKTLNGAEGSYIKFEQGFTPMKITGTAADSVTGTIALKSDSEISENTVIFTTKTIGNGVFDVTGIQPAGSAFGYTLAVISGKAYIKSITLDLNGNKYVLWTDVVAAIEAAKASTTDYTITLLDDYDIGGAIKMPKAGTYNSLTITSENKTLRFTGNVTSTGALNIVNTSLDSAKNGASAKYTVSAGKYQFSAENVNFNLASGSSGTGDVTLKNVTLNGTLKAGVLTLNGTNTIGGTVSASELRSTESGTVLNILNNSKGVMSITKNGITAASTDITLRLTEADGSAAAAAEGAIIASSFKGSYDGQLKLSTDNGTFNVVLTDKGKLVLASEQINSTNALDEEADTEEEEESSEDEESEEEDDTSDDTTEEDSGEEGEPSEGDEGTEEDDGTDDSSDETEGDTPDIPLE